MQNAICQVHLDPNPKFHHQPLSARHQEPDDARAMGSPETRLTYLDGRAPMFDTVPFCRSRPRLVPMNTQSGMPLRSRKPSSLRAMPSQFETSCAISRKGESRRTSNERFSPFESKLV